MLQLFVEIVIHLGTHFFFDANVKESFAQVLMIFLQVLIILLFWQV